MPIRTIRGSAPALVQTTFEQRSQDKFLEIRMSILGDNQQCVPCPREFQAHSIFTRALLLIGHELSTSRTQSELRIDWAYSSMNPA